MQMLILTISKNIENAIEMTLVAASKKQMDYKDKSMSTVPISALLEFKTIRTSRFDIDSDEEEEGLNAIARIERRRQKLHNKIKTPMSTRKNYLKKQLFLSKELGEKHTLRSYHYVPFSQKKRNTIQENRTLKKRGGVEQMEKFVYLRQEMEEQDRLQREAHENSLNVDDIELEIKLAQHDSSYGHDYEKELEKLRKDEEDELDELIASLKLS